MRVLHAGQVSLLSLSTCKAPCGMDSNSTKTQLLEDEDNIFGRSSPVNPTSCESLIGWQPVCDGFCCAPCVSALEDVANCLVTQVWNTTETRSCEMSCPSHNNNNNNILTSRVTPNSTHCFSTLFSQQCQPGNKPQAWYATRLSMSTGTSTLIGAGLALVQPVHGPRVSQHLPMP